MKHWKETEQIAARVADLLSLGRTGAVATVIRITGSAYRRPGARFLIEDDGRTLGGVSGGCLEADVREVARAAVMSTGMPVLLHYDTGSDDRIVWGLGLGCNGFVDVFVQRIDSLPRATLDHLRELLRGDSAFAMATVVSGARLGQSALVEGSGDGARVPDPLPAIARRRLTDRESGVDETSDSLVFTDVLVPPPHLIVCGAGDDARPVVAYAADAGFQVTLVDHRAALLGAERFPQARRLLQLRPDADAVFPVTSDTCVVLMTHSFGLDREWLRRFVATGAGYIGVLGPRARTEEILGQIGARDRDRVFGPVGLDIAADGPEQIAISIVAEMLAVRARRIPRHLREREVAIHAE